MLVSNTLNQKHEKTTCFTIIYPSPPRELNARRGPHAVLVRHISELNFLGCRNQRGCYAHSCAEQGEGDQYCVYIPGEN